MKQVIDLLVNSELDTHAIAKTCNLSSARLIAIMEGAPISMHDVRCIAKGFKIPVRSLLTDQSPEKESPTNLLFRASQLKITGDADIDINQSAHFVDCALEVLPNIAHTHDWISSFAIQEETFSEAERIADLFRSKFLPERGNDALNDLAFIMENYCGIITQPIQSAKFEGASIIKDNHPFIFVAPRFSGRMLFTLAHELGHILAHHLKNNTASVDGPDFFTVSPSKNKQEAFCNAFASCLLLPNSGVATFLQSARNEMDIGADEIGDIEINLLARYYGVSFDVAALRCEQMGLLPKGGAFSIAEKVRQEHKSAEQRAKALGLPDRRIVPIPELSQIVTQYCLKELKYGNISSGWVIDNFPIDISYLYSAHMDKKSDA